MYLDGAALWLDRESAGRIEVLATASTVPGLLAYDALPDVVLLDLALGDGSLPADNVRRLRDAGLAVVIHSGRETVAAVSESLAAGALGFVAKSAPLEELIDAVTAAARGQGHLSSSLAYAFLTAPAPVSLTGRETEVLRLVAAGLTRAAVGHALGIGEGTVKTHLERIRSKYAGAGRAAPGVVDLRRRAEEDGLVTD